MKKHTYVEVIQVGDTVLCDYCNKEWPATDKTSGGFLFESKAVCPDCAPQSLERIKGYHEEKYIRAYCPKDLSFHDWVMKLRGGDNTIKVITEGME